MGSSQYAAFIDGWNHNTNATLFPSIRWSEGNPPPFGGVTHEIVVNNNDVLHFKLYGSSSSTISHNEFNFSSWHTTSVTVDPSFEVIEFTPGDTPVLWASANLPPVPEPFTLSIMPNSSNPGSYDFTWASQIGKIYDLVSNTDLSSPPGSWPVWMGNANIPAASSITHLADIPGGGAPRRFFAVIERDP